MQIAIAAAEWRQYSERFSPYTSAQIMAKSPHPFVGLRGNISTRVPLESFDREGNFRCSLQGEATREITFRPSPESCSKD